MAHFSASEFLIARGFVVLSTAWRSERIEHCMAGRYVVEIAGRIPSALCRVVNRGGTSPTTMRNAGLRSSSNGPAARPLTLYPERRWYPVARSQTNKTNRDRLNGLFRPLSGARPIRTAKAAGLFAGLFQPAGSMDSGFGRSSLALGRSGLAQRPPDAHALCPAGAETSAAVIPAGSGRGPDDPTAAVCDCAPDSDRGIAGRRRSNRRSDSPIRRSRLRGTAPLSRELRCLRLSEPNRSTIETPISPSRSADPAAGQRLVAGRRFGSAGARLRLRPLMASLCLLDPPFTPLTYLLWLTAALAGIGGPGGLLIMRARPPSPPSRCCPP